MTLGKKLSNHRKMLGWTQQQLGEYLNLSAQAVSKWENDLAEPDITTLKSLANLYSLTIDELLNDNETNQPHTSKTEPNEAESKPETIGFCKNCGVVVTEENLGERTPVVLCADCRKAKEAQALAEIERKKAENEKRIRDLKNRHEANSYHMKRTLKKSSIVAGIIAAAFLVIWAIFLVDTFSIGSLFAGLILGYAVFAFVSLLFYDTAVLDVLEYMGTASINWPGVIFTFDLDGFVFLIAIKALFAVLGFLFGLVCAVIGFFVSVFISIFIYPFVMMDMSKCIRRGTTSKYLF